MTNSQPPQNDSQNSGKSSTGERKNKILENPWVGSMVVPVAIVLVGALIIFGVTKMISTDRSYKDLVREMKSKTFGNRWVAAYELSKLIASERIPDEDIPWLIENLSSIYKNSKDSRTKDFIVASLGALQHPKSLSLIERALDEPKGDAQFHALVALGNYPKDIEFNWEKVMTFLDSDDEGLQQSAILALANHRVPEAKEKLERFLTDESIGLRFSAAMGLIYYKSEKSIRVLRNVLTMEPPKERGGGGRRTSGFGPNELQALKLNILHALQEEKWTALNDTLQKLTQDDTNKKLAVTAQEVLNQLKK